MTSFKLYCFLQSILINHIVYSFITIHLAPLIIYKEKYNIIKNCNVKNISDNNLEIFVRAKLIKQLQFNNNKILYEKSLQKRQHDHLICNDCGKINEFCDPRIQNILSGIEKTTNFQIESHSLNVFGNCNKEHCEK